MKNLLSAMTLVALLGLASPDSWAQVYEPSWDAYQYQQYVQYQEYLASSQAYDPYYELHVMHYQLYRPYYSYQLYQPCCYFAVPGAVTRINPPPPAFIGSRSLAVAPLPPAVGALPRAVAPLPRAVGRR